MSECGEEGEFPQAHTLRAHLHQLHEVLEVHLLINAQLARMVHDAVVFHLAFTAHTQCVVSGVVGAFPHQEQASLWWVEKPLGLLPCDFAMEPAGGRQGWGSQRH